jgi:hypothetical protein
MQLRRAVQRTRVRGFTPVINKRVSAQVQTAFAELMIENAEKLATGSVSVETIQNSAIRLVASKLPPERMVFDWRQGLPSKNNDAAYRKA